jgi:hypothetical protein
VINYRAEIANSWVKSAPSARELAALLGLSAPVGLRAIVDRLREVEEVVVESDIHTDDDAAINGRVAFVLRSDGSSIFSGHMRATGFTSYDFAVQGWVATSDGSIVAAQQRGSVYGTDTPGDEQMNWFQSSGKSNQGIIDHWRSLRGTAVIGYKMHAELGGVLGGALDVLEFALKGILANMVVGPQGWLILIGNELAGMDTKLGAPGPLAGVIVAGGTLMIVGPFGLVPAVVAGAAAASVLDVDDRPMTADETNFARQVFGDSIDYGRIRLTNMLHPTETDRRFVIPTVGNTILVNLGDAAFVNPREFTNAIYSEPGSLFIHELVHAWQYTHHSLVEMLCNYADNYEYHAGTDRLSDTSWQGRSWAGFKVEQQAHIVDDWYGAHRNDLGSFAALNDPAFRFIQDEIRNRIP